MARRNRVPCKKSALEAMLGATNLPDATRSRARYVGRRSKSSFSEYWHDLFTLNEELPPKDRKTDETLLTLVLDEFSAHSQLVQLLRSGKYSVNYYRHYFNKGRLCPDRPVQRISFRYGYGRLQGRAVNGRTGSRELSPQEIHDYIRKYRGIGSITNDIPRGGDIRQRMKDAGLCE